MYRAVVLRKCHKIKTYVTWPSLSYIQPFCILEKKSRSNYQFSYCIYKGNSWTL